MILAESGNLESNWAKNKGLAWANVLDLSLAEVEHCQTPNRPCVTCLDPRDPFLAQNMA